MYTDFYRLRDLPFQLGPDPRFFFGSKGHQKAMAYLSYGLSQGEGFIVITGDVGAGKTTLVGRLLESLDPKQFVAGKIVTTQLDAEDTVRMVAGAFGIPSEGVDKATIMQRVETFLRSIHGSGRRSLLVVDEVQNLSIRALEELRMLSNFQVGRQTLLQSFLVGQPQFRPIIGSADLEQLRQRVIASYHLGPLSEDETQAYVEHRLKTVGWQNDPNFLPGTMPLIHQRTGGVPRKINTLCARLLLFGFLENTHTIEPRVVEQVAEELSQELFLISPDAAQPPPMRFETARQAAHGAAPPTREHETAGNGLVRRVEVLEEQYRTHDRKLQYAFSITANLLERIKP
ncbi:MAG TPA: XrtA/PEP-CTERM system-associated ATPase [Candidatus Cybelea sp.]|nr:XrtA/PEP-CTERM system-associated ATPase [Candidatus Cybelea sp.]